MVRKRITFVTLGFLVIVMSFVLLGCGKEKKEAEKIKVGVLYSLSGAMAVQERSLVDIILMAIDQINKGGGVLGRQIEAVVVDGASVRERYMGGVERLIKESKVAVIFGGGNSNIRRALVEKVKEMNGFLINALPYEVGAYSKDVVYMGPGPNQQILPGASWAVQQLGKKVFLVGTDSIYSKVSNEIIKDVVHAFSGDVVGESYVDLNNDVGMEAMMEQIHAVKPDVVMNTMEGENNLGFFKLLRKGGYRGTDIPTVSFALTENLLKRLSMVDMDGDYSVWGYFQSLENEENVKLEQAFRAKYGKGQVIDDPMVSAYAGVYVWAQAVEKSGKVDIEETKKNVRDQSVMMPGGLLYIDPKRLAAYRSVKIGKVQPDSRSFEVVWDSKVSEQPEEYILFRTPQEWINLINSLYEKWDREGFSHGKE